MPQRLILKDFRKQGWRDFQSNEDYHADKTAVSSSSLKAIFESDKQFHARFYGSKTEQTASQLLGTLLHAVVLDHIPIDSVHKFKDTKTDQKMYENLKGMAKAIKNHQTASTNLTGGFAERSGYFKDEETGIHCRIRPDLYDPDWSMLTDLKTCRSIADFQNAIWEYRYDISLEMYATGIEILDKHRPEAISIVAVENSFPYEVAVIDMNPMLDIGRAKNDYNFALKRLKRAIELNTWKDKYQDPIAAKYPGWINNKPFLGEEL